MSAGRSWRSWMSARLLRAATRLLKRRRPDWAAAVAAEGESVDEADRLCWAAGCVVAGFRAPGASETLAYPAALSAGLLALAAYQWSADEGVLTLALVGALGLALGLLSPRRFVLSGVAVGMVVAAVNAFETLTGLLPAYETARHSLVHDLRWTVLVAPALLTAVAGRVAGLRLKP